MPASILPQNQDEKELFNAISSFFSRFTIGNLLRACNAQKEKGVPVTRIFKYKLCNVFTGRSMYMQQRTGSFHESFSKNTFYRFLNSTKTNWLKFTTLLVGIFKNQQPYRTPAALRWTLSGWTAQKTCPDERNFCNGGTPENSSECRLQSRLCSI